MDFFRWDAHYETGFETVDSQHKQLVDLLNRLVGLLTRPVPASQAELAQVFDALGTYTKEHFDDEERLMAEADVAQRHRAYHIHQHAAFITQIESERQAILTDPQAARTLLGFLGQWLVYHILGSDQRMACQIKAIRAGATPAEAYERVREEHEEQDDPVLHALDGMVEQIMERNAQLLRANETLEARVAERTRALQDANARLATLVENLTAEQAETRRLAEELARANDHLSQLALTDALTGLPNRRYALDRLEQMWSEATRHAFPIACLMLDADNFKQINDSWGHDAGDMVLCELAHTLQLYSRQEDVVCRLGGDEFLVLCPRTTLDGAMTLAEHLRLQASKLRVATGKGEWRGSISIGVAARTEASARPNDLVNAADQGLYLAKRRGRNRIASLERTEVPLS